MSFKERSNEVMRARFDRRQVLRFGAVAGIGSVAAGTWAITASGQENAGTPASFGPLPANVSLVTDGLQNPRYLAIADDGTIYISEGGSAGSDAIYATPGASTPTPVEAVTRRGETGFISALAPDGTKTVIADGFPSYLFGTEVVGPSGIALSDGKLIFVNGGAGPSTPILTQLPNENSVISIDLATGEATNIANIGKYELSDNPDPNSVDSNCYDLIVANGIAYVSDAGGNTIYTVDLATHSTSSGQAELKVLAVIPGLPGLGPNPARQDKVELDPVPTGLAMLEDGTLLVGMLSGAPFAPGSAGILKVAPDGTVSNWAGGLTTVVAVAVAPDGTVYATQLTSDFFAEPMGAGSIVRLGVDGSSELVLGGLTKPNGLAFDAAGDLFVIVNTFGATDGGTLLKITDPGSFTNVGVATPEAPEMATPVEAVVPSGLTIEAQDIKFVPKDIEIAARTDVSLTIKNAGFIPHDFRMDSPLTDTGTIDSGSEVTITLNLAPGDYGFYCTVPGHKQAGMIGTIHVK